MTTHVMTAVTKHGITMQLILQWQSREEDLASEQTMLFGTGSQANQTTPTLHHRVHRFATPGSFCIGNGISHTSQQMFGIICSSPKLWGKLD